MKLGPVNNHTNGLYVQVKGQFVHIPHFKSKLEMIMLNEKGNFRDGSKARSLEPKQVSQAAM